MSFLAKVKRQVRANVDAPTGKVHLVRIDSEIYEDSYEEGELDDTGAGLGLHGGKTFKSFKDLLKYLISYHGLSDDYELEKHGHDWTLSTSKMVADHSDAQNGGWMEPTKEEIDSWKKGETKLYVEHYYVKFIEVKE